MMIGRFASLGLLLIAAALPAAAQNQASPTAPSRALAPANPTFYSTPTLAPLAPPTNPGPAVASPGGLSPLLSQPGSMYSAPAAGPSYPATSYPTPLGQEQTQIYRGNLQSQSWQLQREGINNERSRELQEQLNQPNSR
jgi:hypothetical protein